MNVITPSNISAPVLMKMPGGSSTLAAAASRNRGVCRSFDTTRRARSSTGACSNRACPASDVDNRSA